MRKSPYLATMNFLKNADPVGAIADFRAVYREAGANRWWIAALASTITFVLFAGLGWKVWYKAPPKPEIIWITTYAPDRTEAEVIASNIENQKRKDRLAAEQAVREEAARKVYRTIGKMSGMDTEAIEKKAAAERAVAEAKRKREQVEALERLRQSDLAGKR